MGSLSALSCRAERAENPYDAPVRAEQTRALAVPDPGYVVNAARASSTSASVVAHDVTNRTTGSLWSGWWTR